MKNRKLKVYETEYQINNPDGLGYLNQEVKCRFNANVVNW